jgi:Ca2+-binding RTX toxin-like protein
MANVSAQEQLMLELVNRARLDPLAEAARFGIDLNQNLAPGTITAVAKQVLAMNDLLVASSRGHSAWMLQADIFSHTGQGGSDAGQRMTAAGYVFSGSWTWGENISWRGVSPGPIDASSSILDQHRGLFLSAGHRTNILGDGFREIGIAQEIGGFLSNGTNWSASMVTQNFARSGANFFLTGVIYNDGTDDDFYGIGEGVGGVSVTVAGGGGDTSSAAGGYEIGLTGGAKTVTIGGVTLGLTIGAGNVKLDLVNGNEIWTSATVSNVTGAAVIALLGIENIGATGGAAAERITGNAGANTLSGGGGADTLNGGAGADSMDGGDGSDFYYLDNAGDVVTETNADQAAGGYDVVFATVSHTLSANIEQLVLIGGATTGVGNATANYLYGGNSGLSLNLDGGGGDDVIFTGLAGRNTVAGGAGVDTLLLYGGNNQANGGLGSDIYYTYTATDVLSEVGGDGVDTVYATWNITLGAGFEQLLLSGSATAATGSADNNIIYGNSTSAAVSISGLAGADVLYGGAFNDTLSGGAGVDYLFGLGGTNTLIGGDDTDIYYIESAGNSVTETTTGGFDTMYSNVVGNTTLAVNVEQLILYGAATSGTGTSGNDYLYGNSSGNALTLDGADGNDYLLGSAQADVLIGGLGNDTFDLATGGNDFIRFNASGNMGADTVQGFDADATGGQDLIDLGGRGYLSTQIGSAITITASGGNTLVSFATGTLAGTTLTLQGVTTANVTAADFVF